MSGEWTILSSTSSKSFTNSATIDKENKTILINMGTNSYLVPVNRVRTYDDLLKTACLLNTNFKPIIRPRSQDILFTLEITEDNNFYYPRPVILNQFWSEVVRRGLRIKLNLTSAEEPKGFSHLNNILIDETLRQNEYKFMYSKNRMIELLQS